MIRYHGGPCTPLEAALELWTGRHALVSFADNSQMPLVARVAHSFALDNGAFSAWQQGIKVDWKDYAAWVEEWQQHPGFDMALIPDVIDGTEADNDDLLNWWASLPMATPGVPVWHMHESLERLGRLVAGRGFYPTVAIGSSGKFAQIGTVAWWGRISEAMGVACNGDGRPLARLWGLRQMDPTVFSHVPYSFVDSANISRNATLEKGQHGAFKNLTTKQRALLLAFNADRHPSADRWTGSIASQPNLELV